MEIFSYFPARLFKYDETRAAVVHHRHSEVLELILKLQITDL
jgi:hypothetical protein